MANDFNDLCDVGISYPQATEIGRQMAAGTGNANLLCCTGMNATPAIELARQITSGSLDANLLCAAMWNPIQALAIVAIATFFDIYRADTTRKTADTITLTADYAR